MANPQEEITTKTPEGPKSLQPIEQPKQPINPSAGKLAQSIGAEIKQPGINPDQVLLNIVQFKPEASTKIPGLGLFNSETVPEGVKVVLPGAYSEYGIVATRTEVFANQEEVDQAIEASKANIEPGTDLVSLNRSFSSFHRIATEADGRYTVTFPALQSLDRPDLLIGTSRRTFDSWDQARDFYLESRNRNEFPQQAVYEIKVDDVDYKFAHLDKFGGELHLADKPRIIPEATKKVLDFDARNQPPELSASTYYKTIQIPGWQSQVFGFVERYTQTPEGQQIINQLGVKDLRLLTPQQAAKLTLEVVTRLKKYNTDEVGSEMGSTDSDQNSALVLLQRGLNQKDNADFKGNGICRNFASTAKAVFEGIKTNQTRFNYLQNTYAFYESGPRADYDPSYAEPRSTGTIQMSDGKPQIGHAWNSFVTVGEKGITQTTVDSTWSNVDYDTGQSVKLDYTLGRMEKDIYRNLKRKDGQVDPDQAAQFYLFLVDSVPRQDGLVLDPEATTRARTTALYESSLTDLQKNYPGHEREKYDQAALDVYKKIVDQQNAYAKTQFYLDRGTEAIRGREAAVSPISGAEIARLIASEKQNVGYYDVMTVYNLPGSKPDDRVMSATKYVKAWENKSVNGYVPIKDLVFVNKEIQQAILQTASEKTREALLKELGTRA